MNEVNLNVLKLDIKISPTLIIYIRYRNFTLAPYVTVISYFLFYKLWMVSIKYIFALPLNFMEIGNLALNENTLLNCISFLLKTPY
jgi:hypothetical protein